MMFAIHSKSPEQHRKKKDERSNLKRNNHTHWMAICAEGAKEKGGEGKRTTPGIPQTLVTIHSKIIHRSWKDKGCKKMIPSQPGHGSGE